ncbi:SMAD/FHA domain-containing protein, partial [Rhizodiscina lignyota]
RSRQPLPSQQDSFRADPSGDAGEDKPPKEQINWKTTGALAEETNTVKISSTEKIILKYNEPTDARKPSASSKWRLYIFKGKESMGDVQLSSQSCWLMGREEKVADLHVGHPSCSKQHAVIQFRYVPKKQEKKEMGGTVRPYLLDLDSANGTTLNGQKIEPTRFVELREKDIIKFGKSEREYVLLKE